MPSRVERVPAITLETRRDSRLPYDDDEGASFTNLTKTTPWKKVGLRFTHTVSCFPCLHHVQNRYLPLIGPSSLHGDATCRLTKVIGINGLSSSPTTPTSSHPTHRMLTATSHHSPSLSHSPRSSVSQHMGIALLSPDLCFSLKKSQNHPPRPIQFNRFKWPRQSSTQEQKSLSASSTSPRSYAY
jgi:hypothetical protein